MEFDLIESRNTILATSTTIINDLQSLRICQENMKQILPGLIVPEQGLDVMSTIVELCSQASQLIDSLQCNSFLVKVTLYFHNSISE